MLSRQMGADTDYETSYETFDSPLSRQMRGEAYGEDVGQHSWVTASELKTFIPALGLTPERRLLDIGCGPAGPLTFIVAKVGCRAIGLDLSGSAITAARARAAAMGVDRLITLQQADSNEPVPFADGSFDSVISLDVVLHLHNREALFGEVKRVLTRGGRFWFTDAGIITGPFSSQEMAVRSSRGYTQFVPSGFNEQALERARLTLVQVEDRTDDLISNATGRIKARLGHRAEVEVVEGRDGFDRETQYLETVVELAKRKALSRFAFVAQSK